MQMTASLEFEATPEQVLAVLSDPEFVEFASHQADMELVSADINVLDSGAVTLVVRRTAKSDFVPANFRSFVGNRIELRQTEAWAEPVPSNNETRYGTFDLEIVGAPVRISGNMTLTASGSRAHLTYAGDVVASVPLFGGTIEKAVGGVIQQVLANEQPLITQWLNR